MGQQSFINLKNLIFSFFVTLQMSLFLPSYDSA